MTASDDESEWEHPQASGWRDALLSVGILLATIVAILVCILFICGLLIIWAAGGIDIGA